MKKILYFLFLIIGFGSVQAQPHLRVSNISGAPFSGVDTAYEANTYDSIHVTVVNEDTVVFADSILILIQANSQPVDTLYSDVSPTTILVGDSVDLIRSNYVFAATHFDDGDNIIVVWPSAIQTPVLADSLTIHIYYFSLIANTRKLENEILTLYPNPATQFISLRIPEELVIKQVRIFNSLGKIVYSNSAARKFIPIDKLSPGMYFIEIEKLDGTQQSVRFIRN